MKTGGVENFMKLRLGLFIHWGLYAIPAGEWKGQPMRGNGYAEQINNNCRIPNREYEPLAGLFQPQAFDAETWVRLARNAGMRYLVFTAKHQDGFAMFHSKVTDFNVVDATPFARDPLAEIAAACAKYDVRLGIYYSHARDFHCPGANWNDHGNTWDFSPQTEADFENYFESLALPQVKELLSSYGEIFLMWFDVPYQIPARLSRRLRDWVKGFQPECLVNSRIGNGFGDYESLGDNQLFSEAVTAPFEACVTMNETWGYSKHDEHWKTPAEVIRIAETVFQKGGNLLLNVGPDAQGSFPEPAVGILEALGLMQNQPISASI